MVALPTYADYKAQVDDLVSRDELLVEDGIIMLSVFRNHLEDKSSHVKHLMQVTGLDWRKINYRLNSLTLKGGIKKIDKYWYTL